MDEVSQLHSLFVLLYTIFKSCLGPYIVSFLQSIQINGIWDHNEGNLVIFQTSFFLGPYGYVHGLSTYSKSFRFDTLERTEILKFWFGIISKIFF